MLAESNFCFSFVGKKVFGGGRNSMFLYLQLSCIVDSVMNQTLAFKAIVNSSRDYLIAKQLKFLINFFFKEAMIKDSIFRFKILAVIEMV